MPGCFVNAHHDRQIHIKFGFHDYSTNYIPYTLSGRMRIGQGSCLACCGCTFGSPWGCTDLYYARGAQGVLLMRVGGATSQLDLPSLTPLSVAACG